MNFVELISSVIFWEIFTLIITVTVIVFCHSRLDIKNLILCSISCMICVGDYVVVGDYKITPPLSFFVLLCTVSIFSSYWIRNVRNTLIYLGYCSILLGVEVLFYNNYWVTVFTSSMLLNLLMFDFIYIIKTHINNNGLNARILSQSNIIYSKFNKIVVEDRGFLNPDINLDDIAAQIGTNRTYLSKTINGKNNTSFVATVNHYRVEYAMKYMIKHPKANLDVIAQESGFKSTSTLFYAFKKETGKSPKDWYLNER